MPRKKAFSIKASLISKLSESTGKTFSVVASLSNSDVDFKKFELASFGCKSCKSEFAAVKGSEPFCVVCSSDKVIPVKVSAKIENLAKIDKSELAAIECSHCHVNNILSITTASMLDTKMNCVQCGTELEYELPDEESSDDVDLPNPNIVTDNLSDEEDTIDFTESAEVYDEHLPPAEPSVSIDTAIETKQVKTPTVTEQKITTSDTQILEGEEFPLLEVTDGDLELSRFGDVIVASKNNVPVATLSKDNCSAEHANYFHSKSFTNGINHVVKTQGASKALASFNFELTKVKLPVPQIIESRVSKQVTASTQELSTKLKELSEDFQQCLSLAAVGLNKNYFKGKQNVLKASLIDNLKAAGLRNPEKLVASCFAQHSNSAHKTLLEIANSLMSKTVEARNELAEAFGEINEIDEDDSDTDYNSDTDSSSLESRLETASISVQRKPQQIAVASVQEIVSSARANHIKLF